MLRRRSHVSGRRRGAGQLGIILDDVVLSAPTINVASFDREQIQISGSFDQESAESLAVALRFGSLPIELAPSRPRRCRRPWVRAHCRRASSPV